jgi:uncharacterized protein (TIGR03067 family)
MQRHFIFAVWLVGIFTICAAAIGQDGEPANKALAELQGVWKLTSVEHDGGTREFAERAPHWVVKGRKIFYGADELATITADAATNPKCVDFVFRRPKAEREGIYEIKDGTWKLCINWDPAGVKERPQNCSIKDKPAFRGLVFEKVNIKEADAAKAGMGFIGVSLKKLDGGGLSVGMVLPDSPAKKAGLMAEDLVLQVGGNDVGELLATVKAIQQVEPGSELTLRIKRDDKEMDIKLKAGLVPFHFLMQ